MRIPMLMSTFMITLLAVSGARAEPAPIATSYADCKALPGTMTTGERAKCAKCVGAGFHGWDSRRVDGTRCQARGPVK